MIEQSLSPASCAVRNEYSGDDGKWAAFLRRDPAADGKFFAGVRTTGVYCRSICGGRPMRRNVTFFASPAEAREAGLRPCQHCRPPL